MNAEVLWRNALARVSHGEAGGGWGGAWVGWREKSAGGCGEVGPLAQGCSMGCLRVVGRVAEREEDQGGSPRALQVVGFGVPPCGAGGVPWEDALRGACLIPVAERGERGRIPLGARAGEGALRG